MDSSPEKQSTPLLEVSARRNEGSSKPKIQNLAVESQYDASKFPKTMDYPTPMNLYKMLKFDALTTMNIWSYGVGHFQNDITATTLLNYMPLFLKAIAPIHHENPGYYLGICILIGQIVDGISTPLVGLFSDRIHTRIGKRMPWYFSNII